MKKKITISLDENILERIDILVKKWVEKNRSFVIENILKERFWDFQDITCIVFAYDYKWDNRKYPFDKPKSLLSIRGISIIHRQIQLLSKSGITDFIICVPENEKEVFEIEIISTFPWLQVSFLELPHEELTWRALRNVMENFKLKDNIIISNGDIYYGDLDIEKYYTYHKNQKSDFSFCLKFVMTPEQLWNVGINWNRILAFVEKPESKPTYLINSGLYITTRKFLEKHDYGEYLEKNFFPKLPEISNTIWYIYSWQWEHIQNDSAYERVNNQVL